MKWMPVALIIVAIIAVIYIVKYYISQKSIKPLTKENNSLSYDNECYRDAFNNLCAQLSLLNDYFRSLKNRAEDISKKLSCSVQKYITVDSSRRSIRSYSFSLTISPLFSRSLFTATDQYRSSKYQKPFANRLQDLYTAINEYCEVAGAIVSDTTLYVEKISDILLSKETYESVLNDYEQCQQKNSELQTSISFYKNFYEHAKSNLSLFPYMAGIVSEFETRDIETLARKLDWGHSFQRFKKVESIRDIRRDAMKKIEQAKEAEYQLAYLLQMFPYLQELLEYEYTEIPSISPDSLTEHDAVRDYLSKDEWAQLSESERNQLALDRYIESRKKTNWQIGRDYEEYVGYCYRSKGFTVDNYGACMGIDDLGRDIIAAKNEKLYIIQCKYWSKKKEIHENHINQLFGTVTSYCIENGLDSETAVGVLVTNTVLSDRAKEFAKRLNILYVEHFDISDYPRIKCNISKGDKGSKIYHLPFDQQYDSTKICNPGEFYAFTVEEAESAGFRRAYRWHGTS